MVGADKPAARNGGQGEAFARGDTPARAAAALAVQSEQAAGQAHAAADASWSAAGTVRPLNIVGAFIYYGSGKFEDGRGFYEEIKFPSDIVGAVEQSGYAVSQCNVLRGMHCSPYGKLVVCLAGEMFDALIDLRPESETYLCWDAVTLSPELQTRIYVPPRVAHGYVARADATMTLYLKLGCYDKHREIEVNALDPALGIPWPPPLRGASEYVISKKDRDLPRLEEVRMQIEVSGGGTARSRL